MQFEIELIMEVQKDERVTEAVSKFLVLYHESERCFRERIKKRLAWENVVKEINLVNFTSLFFIFFKACSFLFLRFKKDISQRN